MDIKEFFNDKDKVENFLKAKTEQEARSTLESECGKVSDEDFNEIKKGFITAVSDEAFGKTSGGINMKSPLAKTVYALGGAALVTMGIGVAYKTGSNSGYSAGHESGFIDGQQHVANRLNNLHPGQILRACGYRDVVPIRDNGSIWISVGDRDESGYDI